MVIRTKTITEMALSMAEINALQVLAGVSCEGYACHYCPLNIRGTDNCAMSMARQVLDVQNIPYTERPNEEINK